VQRPRTLSELATSWGSQIAYLEEGPAPKSLASSNLTGQIELHNGYNKSFAGPAKMAACVCHYFSQLVSVTATEWEA
jgi:hypothetical protein